jgi:hypothetical protein
MLMQPDYDNSLGYREIDGIEALNTSRRPFNSSQDGLKYSYLLPRLLKLVQTLPLRIALAPANHMLHIVADVSRVLDIDLELSRLRLGAVCVTGPGLQVGNAAVELLALTPDHLDGVGGPADAAVGVAFVVDDEVEGAGGAAHEVVEIGGPGQLGVLFLLAAVVVVVDPGDRG